MRDNNSKMPYGDHELALKLLHALDRNVWGIKVDAITESPNYETLTLEDLYSKLRSTEIDIKSRAKLESPPASSPHSTALVVSSRPSSTNSVLGAFSLSALLSVSEEQVDELDDEELALITKRFMRFNDNRRFRKRGNHCYECGKPGHFAAECPNKNKFKDEPDFGKHKNDYGRGKNKDKHKKKRPDRDYRKKKNKARAFASVSDVTSDSSTSSESSSSEEEDVGKKKKGGKNVNGLCFYTESRQARRGYAVMAIDANGDTSDKESDPEQDSEVTDTPLTREQLVAELEDLQECFLNKDKILKKAAKERETLKAELETALNELEALRSNSTSSAASDDLPECAECDVHMTSLVSLKSKYADLVDELDASRAALDEIKSRPVLLKPCDSCSVLRTKLDDACARIALLEKSPGCPSETEKTECECCPALHQEIADFKYSLSNSENENWNLRAILGWISAREPQLGMIISKFKKGDGFGIGLSYNRVYNDYGKIGECSGVNPSEKPPPSTPESSETKPTQNLDGVVEGVFQEPTREPSKNQVWVEKPNHLRNPLDTLPPAANRRPAPQPKAKPQPPPRKPPQPVRQPVGFHCDYCH